MSSFRTNIFASSCQRNCSTSELERPQAGADWHRFGTFRVDPDGVVEGLDALEEARERVPPAVAGRLDTLVVDGDRTAPAVAGRLLF